MEIEKVFFDAKWTPDCCGKFDLDFPILRISTRYWCDASSKVLLILGEDVVFESDYIYGESEADCKAKTEKWIKSNVKNIVSLIKKEFNVE